MTEVPHIWETCTILF